ncbi:hypothetical protein B0T21DRAFT_414428 [Apiosordaria backusii]|uniref:Uncharacterized protein n=1 Tax=Apiosordaria backusii TaxID=314023 RepID=A0AA40ASK9_9PEZI|nr:hypothetical protein B0T21DRAFT_414428 [Apiosordaria backusii]
MAFQEEVNDSQPSLMALMMAYTPPSPPSAPPPPLAAATKDRTLSPSVTLEPPTTDTAAASRTSTTTTTAQTTQTNTSSTTPPSSGQETQVKILSGESIQVEVIQQPPKAHTTKANSNTGSDLGDPSEEKSEGGGLKGEKVVTIVTPARSHQDVENGKREGEDAKFEEEVGSVRRKEERWWRRGCGGCLAFWWGVMGKGGS